jgi:hypothetical protein
MPLSKVSSVGTKADRKSRHALKRCDDLARKTAVSNAQKAIYEKHRGVTSTAVERLLQEDSLSPALVRSYSMLGHSEGNIDIVMI